MKRVGMKDKWRLNAVELSADEIIELNDGLEFYYHDILRHRDRLLDIDDRTPDQERLLKQFQEQATLVLIMIGKITQAEEELLTFKPGDVVSKFDDNRCPLCVDEIAKFTEDTARYPGEEYMYAVTEHGFGLTSLDPKDFHLVPDDVKKKYFATLKENGIVYRQGKFRAVKKNKQVVEKEDVKFTECPKCGGKLRYTEKDIRKQQSHMNEYQYFVTCPVCGEEICVGCS